MLSDLRYAIRAQCRTPGFAAVAIVTLAVGIGGATAIFSVVDAILLRPLPYREAHRILDVDRVTAAGTVGAFSAADFLDVKRDATHFASLAGFREDVIDLTGRGEPVRVPGVQTTAAFFDVFDMPALVGRTYSEASDRPGDPLAVIGEGLWRRHFGGRRDIVGTSVGVSGKPLTIVGVVPERFGHPIRAEIWTLSPEPVPVSPILVEDGDELADREVQYFGAVGRLKEGFSLAGARNELGAIGKRLAEAFPDSNTGESFVARPLAESLVADVRTALLVLLGAVASVLLIACANVAGLMLARGIARRREMAVRASLGAGTARLVRQLLTESLLLALVGGVAGLLVATWLLEALLMMAPDSIPRLQEVRLDWRVAAVSFLVTTFVGVLFGLAPALQSSRPDLNEDLRDGGRTSTSHRTKLRSALVVAQVAAALVLLIGAGLMATSLLRLRAVDPGFRTSSLVAVDLPLPQTRYAGPAQARFYADVLALVQAHPGVTEAAMAFPLPLRSSTASATYEIEGQDAGTRSQSPIAEMNAVSPEYFQTVGVRLVRGRTFAPEYGPNEPLVVIINQRLAKEFGDRDPLGARINVGTWATIVGIVTDARRQSLDVPPQPSIYLSYQQFTLPFMGVMVRTNQPASAVASAVRSAVTSLDPDLPIGDVLTIEQIIEESTGQPRFRTLLILVFAGIAVLLAAVGVYGLISFAVTERSAEMGLRLALGASPWQVCGLVMKQGLSLAAIGVAAGVALALASTRVISGLLFDTSSTDPWIYGGLGAALLTIAALACYVPARRAMRVDPMTTLRAD